MSGDSLYGVTVILSADEPTVVLSESLRLTVKLNVPAVVGLPEIIPVAEFSVNPDGSAPLAMFQV